MIGELNRKITLKSWTNTQDDAGGNIKTLSSSFSVWAKVEDRQGERTFSGGQEQFSYDYKITMRFRPVISQRMTITYDSKNLIIRSLSIKSEGNKRFFIARCSVNG
jgi:SPP1 family predicted phage head-tail adaptor